MSRRRGSAVATQPVTDAIKAVRKDGRIVLIGLKRGEPLEQLAESTTRNASRFFGLTP